MMKLRTAKNTQLSKFDFIDDQTPSTSSASPSSSLSMHGLRRYSTNSNDQQQPDSPIGRIAKSNARILNGLDLTNEKGAGFVIVNMLGSLPDLKINELNDQYPVINKLLENDKKLVDTETLHLLQFELEDLIAQNMDFQKTIHGEITYLTTGDYPTTDLNQRPMPKFELIRKQEQQKLRERMKHVESASATSLADLDILSSPEDEDAPNILDVPSRFWHWSKEYLRPISKDFVKEFKEKIVDRFSEEAIISVSSPAVVNSNKNKRQKRKAAPEEEQQKTAAKKAKLSKSPDSVKKPSLSKEASMEDCGHLSNGYHSKTNGFILPTNGLLEWSHLTKANNNNSKSMKTMMMGGGDNTPKSSKTVVETESEGEEEDEDDGEAKKKVETPTKTGRAQQQKSGHGEAQDEVSAELEKKQAQLRALLSKTRPSIEQLYVRVLKECAIYEVFSRLDSADDSLHQLSSKYERLNLFLNKEQRQEAKHALQNHAKTYRKYHHHSDVVPSKK